MGELAFIEPAIRHLAVPIGDLRADAGNLRTHSERNLQNIRRSLADFRQQTPIVRDADGVIRKGNGTLEAALALGWSHVAVVESTLRGAAAARYAVADNRSGDQDVGSGWADDALTQFLADLADTDPAAVESTGFAADEVQALIDATVAAQEEAEKPLPAAVEIGEQYAVMVTCEGEADQRAVYELLTGRGYGCRVLTL